MKPLIVGENNPYVGGGGCEPDDTFALYPEPRGCAGWRLCHLILRMEPDIYLGAFDRCNLLHQEKWSIKSARHQANKIKDNRNCIILGSKVCAAFGYEFRPFTVVNGNAIIPHPSGLCRLWHEAGSFERARDTIMELAGVT